MKTNPFKLRDDCVQYKVIDIEHLDSIVRWAVINAALGADIWFDFSNRVSWVIVPEVALDSFLNSYGKFVSAC